MALPHSYTNRGMLISHLKNMAIQMNFAPLVTGTKSDRDRIANECYSKGLVPAALTDASMKEVIHTVQDKITTDRTGAAFDVFLEILSYDKSTEHLAKLVSETFQELEQRPDSLRPFLSSASRWDREEGVEDKEILPPAPPGSVNSCPPLLGLPQIDSQSMAGGMGYNYKGGSFIAPEISDVLSSPLRRNRFLSPTPPPSATAFTTMKEKRKSPSHSPFHSIPDTFPWEPHPPYTTFTPPPPCSSLHPFDDTNACHVLLENQESFGPELSYQSSTPSDSDSEINVPKLGSASVVETNSHKETTDPNICTEIDVHSDEFQEETTAQSSKFGKRKLKRDESIESIQDVIGDLEMCKIGEDVGSCCEHAEIAKSSTKKKAKGEKRKEGEKESTTLSPMNRHRLQAQKLKQRVNRQERKIRELEAHISEYEREKEKSAIEMAQLRTEFMYMEVYFNEMRADKIRLLEELSMAERELVRYQEREKMLKERILHMESTREERWWGVQMRGEERLLRGRPGMFWPFHGDFPDGGGPEDGGSLPEEGAPHDQDNDTQNNENVDSI